ncbi:Flagellar biosynthesis protein FliT [Cupriavidus sp. U2]|uniref:flagellar protein FliT n=1 Tax=Cupriavidus sp. U2 TaxID=2920269 RepID=UPI00129EBA9A|nr:flagellar protein FliT [Cupriavidus sp. U2]KAI3590817.1 Flagellar biosynthesis protein FliT [Cupriavidus sp. U2]
MYSNMPANASVIQIYEELVLLSEQMLEAARHDNWDAMTEVQRVYVAQVDALRSKNPPPPATLQERMQHQALLARLLAHDAAIRDLVMPQLQRLGELLGNARRRRGVNDAYGVSA